MFYVLELVDNCGDYALANILSLVQTIFSIICVVVPIILVVSLVISIFSLVTNPDQKDGLKKIVTKVVAALIVFFLPMIVNFVMAWLPGDKFDIVNCWNKAATKSEEISMVVK